MSVLKFTILGNAPAKANNYRIINRNGKKSLIKASGVRAYEKAFVLQTPATAKQRIDDSFKISVDFYFRSDASDLDNGLKTVLDCLQYANVITNDKNCVNLAANKYVDKSNPRVVINLIRK